MTVNLIQVNFSHYYSEKYESKVRFISYWHQISEIRQRQPKNILEVGIGSGFVSHYLRRQGLNVTTIDIDTRLQPDIVAGVAALPFKESSFPLVACFEVLEHLPYDQFIPALMELSRVSQQWVIISLPDATRAISFMLRSTGRPKWTKSIAVPHLRKREHQFVGEHFWEIGKKGYPFRRIKVNIEKAGLKLCSTYRLPEHLYHRFFILEK
jgi:ubiquinone/menaquinone biosynthesis C-methylase UbiE